MDNHVSFGNIVFGLASAQHSTGFVGCALFYDSNKHYWHGYLAEHKNAAFQPLDTLRIIQTSMGDFQCIVENIASEPGMLHIALRPIRKEVFPNTYCEGFVYVGKEKIKDKILSK